MRYRHGLGGSDGVTASIAGFHGAQNHRQCYGVCGFELCSGAGSKCGCQRSASKAWSINRISQVDASEVSIDRRRTGVILTLEYQTVFPLVGPIQGVWDFGTVEVDGR